MKEDKILLFDGICNLCNGAVQFILKHESGSHIQFASLQSDAGQQLLNTYQIDTNIVDSIVFIENDKPYVKSAAAFKVANYLKRPWKYFSAFRFVPISVSDFFYDVIAKYRYKFFGKLDECWVPTPELSSRFI